VTEGTPRPADLALGVLTLAIAVTYYVMAAAIPESGLADAVGPQGLPKAYALALGGLSLVLVARGLAARRHTGPPPHAAGERPRALWRAAGMLLIGVGYIALAPYAGYILTIAALLVATTYYQGGRVDRHVAAVGVSGALLLWVLFVVLLGIPQPSGIWPSAF
jgi:putative tricarboxylic transport membrane protein